MQSVAESAGFSTSGDVAVALTALLDASEPEEEERRAIAALGTAFFRPQRPMSEVANAAKAFIRDTLVQYSDEAVNRL